MSKYVGWVALSTVVGGVAIWGLASPHELRGQQGGVVQGGVVQAGAADAPGATAISPPRRPVPFGVGEQFVYQAKASFVNAGTGQMEVVAIEPMHGRPAYHIVFTITGGIPGFRVDDHYDSWIDTATLSSLKYVQKIHEGFYHRETTYEIYPERAVYTKDGGPEIKGVSDPLDDGSFVYFVRTVPMEVGERQEFNRYFVPDKNPVVLTALRLDTISVPAGKFEAIVIHPTIKAGGLFGEGGDAQLWFTRDSRRLMLQMKAKLSVISLSLYLKSYRPPTAGSPGH